MIGCTVISDQALEGIQLRGNGFCGLIATVDDDIDASGVETHHRILVKVRSDRDIRDVHVGHKGITAHQVYSGIDYVSQIVDLPITTVAGIESDTDNDVSSDFPGKVGRIVVAHSSVDKHHSIRLDRREESRDRHRGAQRGVDLALRPDLGRAADQVRRHAKERNREIIEITLVLIPDSQRTEYVVDILAVDHSRREASQNVFLDHPCGIHPVRSEMQVTAPAGILHLVHNLMDELICLIVEREGKGISVLVLDL